MTVEKENVLTAMVVTYGDASDALTAMADHVRSGIEADQSETSNKTQATLTMTVEDWNSLLSVMDEAGKQFRELVDLIELGVVTTVGE